MLLTKLLGVPEEINGHERCPTYLYRWTVLATRWFKVYVHHFVGDDWSRDLHDHPKRFISIGLKGWYREWTPRIIGTNNLEARDYHAPWFRTFPPTHIHRITTPSKDCWTLIIVGPTVREWGFWHGRYWMPWRRYVEGEGGIADKMRACD